MRKANLILLFCALFCANDLLATQPKEPWLWTAGERVSERFSQKSKNARMSVALERTRKAPPDTWPIDGRTHPELFFPWELTDSFLRELDMSPSHRERRRSSYRKHIDAAGWDYETFWREVDVSAVDYVIARRNFRQLRERIRQSPDPRQERQVSADLCAARHSVMTTMRTRFGAIAFDRFLYTALAPQMGSWTSDQRDAATLIRTENGCK